MKKISIIIFTMVFVLLFAVPASAVNVHKELFMTMDIPDSFQEVEDDADSSITSYIDYNTARSITITQQMRLDDVDYGNLTYYELDDLEEGIVSGFNQKGTGAYFTSDPEASSVTVNSYKGVKVQTTYIDPSAGNLEVHENLYIFSTKSYVYTISFAFLNDDESWYEDCLDSLIIGKGYLEDTPTTETYGDEKYSNEEASNTSFTASVTSSDTSDNSGSSGLADFFEGVGTVCGIVLIVYLVCRFLFKKK